jgi:hypothetical protein
MDRKYRIYTATMSELHQKGNQPSLSPPIMSPPAFRPPYTPLLLHNERKLYVDMREELTPKEVWHGLREKMTIGVKSVFTYTKELPGLGELCSDDLNILVKSTFFLVSLIFLSKLYLDGEFYLRLPGNIRLSRKWVAVLMGTALGERILAFMQKIKDMDISERERALLIPCIITSRSGII